MGPLVAVAVALAAALGLALVFLPATLRLLGEPLGVYLRRSSRLRRDLLLDRVAHEEQHHHHHHHHQSKPACASSDWRGIVAFFHPFCNAGGGGERVLWAAVRATQRRWPQAVCVVYTGDHDADKPAILANVRDRFNMHLHPPTIHFLYLSTRHLVLSSTWPRFTLLGQSLGSLALAYDAFSLLVPDVFVDTMGYAFAVSLCALLFPDVPTAAYVHYPTISTDMLTSLDAPDGQGVHAGTGAGYRGFVKRQYWHLFARLYSSVGSTMDVVMTNSTWTQTHIKSLWGPYRSSKSPDYDIDVVFPPVAVEELERHVAVSPESEEQRGPYLLYIAQFRPEKNHKLVLQAFASLIHSNPSLPAYPHESPKLVLIGSVRHDEDKTRVYELRLLANELGVKDNVEFVCNATWSQMLAWMRTSSVGINGMWNEHFGIGVVEYQAAGLISVVNDSGGPKLDIVVEMDGEVTGFHASTAEQYATAFHKALSLSPGETLAMRQRARKSALRFTDAMFADKWIANMERLVKMRLERTGST